MGLTGLPQTGCFTSLQGKIYENLINNINMDGLWGTPINGNRQIGHVYKCWRFSASRPSIGDGWLSAKWGLGRLQNLPLVGPCWACCSSTECGLTMKTSPKKSPTKVTIRWVPQVKSVLFKSNGLVCLGKSWLETIGFPIQHQVLSG